MPASQKPAVEAAKGGRITVADLRLLIRMCDDVGAHDDDVIGGKVTVGGRLTRLEAEIDISPSPDAWTSPHRPPNDDRASDGRAGLPPEMIP